jgi:hypothetical protein
MPRGFDAIRSASDAERREQLANRPAAGFAADRTFLADTDEDLELFLAVFAAEFVKRHRTLIVEDFRPPGKRPVRAKDETEKTRCGIEAAMVFSPTFRL